MIALWSAAACVEPAVTESMSCVPTESMVNVAWGMPCGAGIFSLRMMSPMPWTSAAKGMNRRESTMRLAIRVP